MKHIKRFSQLVTESTGKAAEIQEVVKKLGYNSLEEIKKEKALLTKLEGLMKELGTSVNVSEDEAEEIEDKVLAKGAPKSLVSKMGKKEEDGEPGGEGEVAEGTEDEIEKKIVKKGEPKAHHEEEGEEVVTKDQKVTSDVEGEEDDEDAGVKVPKARIMTFEEFISEREVTVNKNVSYRDDAEEEDEALPVAERKGSDGIIVKDNMGRALAVAAGDVADYKKGKDVWASDEDGEEYEINIDDTDIISEDASEEIEDETVAMGKPKKHSSVEGDVFVTTDQEIEEDPEESEDESDVHATVVVEKKITSEKDFEEYAMEIMKRAHPDNFDQEIADKVVADLKDKYKGDFGAMVGALQSGMGK